MNNVSHNAKLLYQVKDSKSALRLIEINKTLNSEKLSVINAALSQLMNSIHESKEAVQYHDSELEGKIFRFVMGNSSLLKLLSKVSVQFNGKTYEKLDLPTIYSVTRMQIESFIMIYYLSFTQGTTDERDMRYDLYKLHGLKKQSNYTVRTNYGEMKKEEVLKEYDDVMNSLKSRRSFISLDSKLKKDMLKLKYAKVIKPHVLFRESGLSKVGFSDAWSLYSNHTHSEYISDRQFKTYYGKKKQTKPDVKFNIQLHIILTSKLCKFLIDKFESPKKVISRLDEASRIMIYTWGYQIVENIQNES